MSSVAQDVGVPSIRSNSPATYSAMRRLTYKLNRSLFTESEITEMLNQDDCLQIIRETGPSRMFCIQYKCDSSDTRALERILSQGCETAEQIVATVGVTEHNDNIYASFVMDKKLACTCYIYYRGRMYSRSYFVLLAMWITVAAGIVLTILLETRTDKQESNFSSVDTLILMLSYWGLIPYLVSVTISKHGLLSDHMCGWYSSKHLRKIRKCSKCKVSLVQYVRDVRKFNSANTCVFDKAEGYITLDENLTVEQWCSVGLAMSGSDIGYLCVHMSSANRELKSVEGEINVLHARPVVSSRQHWPQQLSAVTIYDYELGAFESINDAPP
ncbi:hypothetical protein INT43_007408 [Umbelopsis isabellina]|uniref:Uncharacterized protein n=1 Tax=Mortierella isabellina TaxID=91625 RepID=A0A8H7PYB8_MORIS|nr:hypothetical protein INT43_007408 [Umbelopsis isabellina]